MLPDVMLLLNGSQSMNLPPGRSVELYHISMQTLQAKRETKIRYKTLRKYLKRVSKVGSNDLHLPPKEFFHNSCSQTVVDSRTQSFRVCLRQLSSVLLSEKQVNYLHSMFDEADKSLHRFKSPKQSVQSQQSTIELDDEPHVLGAIKDLATTPDDQLWPATNAFVALPRRHTPVNDDEYAMSIDNSELQEYLEKWGDDMLGYLHINQRMTQRRNINEIDLAHRPRDELNFDFTKADETYLENYAKEHWSLEESIPQDTAELVLQRNSFEGEDDSMTRHRGMERALEISSKKPTRGHEDSDVEDLIKDMVTTYFPEIFTEEPSMKKKNTNERESMSQVLQGYIDDMYYNNASGEALPSPERRGSVSLTA